MKNLPVRRDKLSLSNLEACKTDYFGFGIQSAVDKLQKEIVLHNKLVEDYDKTRDYLSANKPDKIQIGSGQHKLEDWTNLDLGVDADVQWDIREGLPFEDNSLSVIFMEHTLEHIDYPKSAHVFYKEAFRTLKPQGRLIVGVPDAGLATKKYIEKDEDFFRQMLTRWYKNRDSLGFFNTDVDLLNYIFRDEDNSDKYTPHLWAYDFDKLKQLAEWSGFEDIKRWVFDEKIANPKRKWGSIYAVCKKPKEEK